MVLDKKKSMISFYTFLVVFDIYYVYWFGHIASVYSVRPGFIVETFSIVFVLMYFVFACINIHNLAEYIED